MLINQFPAPVDCAPSIGHERLSAIHKSSRRCGAVKTPMRHFHQRPDFRHRFFAQQHMKNARRYLRETSSSAVKSPKRMVPSTAFER